MPKVSGLSAAKVRCTVELEGWFNKEMEVATEQEAFARLLALPPDSPYWKNRWMFTKPVFLNESMQGNDPARFGRWLRLQPKALTNHIYAAPSNDKGVGLDAAGGQSHTTDGFCPE